MIQNFYKFYKFNKFKINSIKCQTCRKKWGLHFHHQKCVCSWSSKINDLLILYWDLYFKYIYWIISMTSSVLRFGFFLLIKNFTKKINLWNFWYSHDNLNLLIANICNLKKKPWNWFLSGNDIISYHFEFFMNAFFFI